MNGKRIAGVVCLILGALLLVGAISSLTFGEGPGLTDPRGLGVSRAVGAFLPSLVALIVGL
jgi:hypothetical protein